MECKTRRRDQKDSVGLFCTDRQHAAVSKENSAVHQIRTRVGNHMLHQARIVKVRTLDDISRPCSRIPIDKDNNRITDILVRICDDEAATELPAAGRFQDTSSTWTLGSSTWVSPFPCVGGSLLVLLAPNWGWDDNWKSTHVIVNFSLARYRSCAVSSGRPSSSLSSISTSPKHPADVSNKIIHLVRHVRGTIRFVRLVYCGIFVAVGFHCPSAKLKNNVFI